MAGRSELLYWTGTLWASATYRTYTGGAWADVSYLESSPATTQNPVTGVSIDEALGNPRGGTVTISNRPKDFKSTTDHEGRGRFTGAFTDFQDVRIRDIQTGVILLAGKIYDLEEKYDTRLGNLIVLTIRDNLEELKNYVTGNWVDKPLNYSGSSRISGEIDYIIDNAKYVNSSGIGFSDTDKFESSATQHAAAGKWQFKGNNNTALKTIARLAALDPHESGNTDDFGYDYFVDPAVVTRDHDEHGAEAAFNYFKRGTRPTTAPNTHGLSIKYPTTEFSQDGYNLRMFNDFSFKEPKGELYSDVIVTYQDSGSQTSGGAEVPDTEGDTEKVKTRRFERIDVTSISGDFTSENSGSNIAKNVPFGKTEIVKFVASDGSPNEAYGFGRIEYQSVDSGTGFLIVSPLDADAYTPGSSGHDATNPDGHFNSDFPEEAGTITGITSGVTASTGASCRPAKNFGVKKSRNVTVTDSTDPRKVRDQVVSFLSRNTTVIKRGTYKVTNYPHHYIDAAAADVSRSGGTITFASTPFATNGGSATNNPQLFGVQKGDIIAELDATASSITRYAYISTVSSSTVQYSGNTAAETSDGTALDASKPMRIYIPLRAGHVIQVTNTLANVSGIHLVTDIGYQEDNGVSFTTIASIGKNDSALRLGQTGFEPMIEGATKYGDDNPGAFTNLADVTSWTFTGNITAASAAQINWGAGKLYDDTGGNVYDIGIGNTGTMSEESLVYFDPTSSTTAFATSTKATYQEKKERIKIMAANDSTTAEGSEATFSFLTPVSGSGTVQSLVSAAAALSDNSMTSALAKKGVQEWSASVSFVGLGSTNGAYNKIKFGLKGDTDDPLANIDSNANLQFADGTDEVILTSDAGTSSLGNSSSVAADGTVTLAAGYNYIYKNVGDSASTTLLITSTYSLVYADNAVLLCMVLVQDADDESKSPSIFPFTANEGTISAGVISAGAILADALTANLVLSTKVVAGTGTFDSNLYGVAIGSLGSNRTFAAQANGVTQVEIISSGTNPGILKAGGGNVRLDADGLTIDSTADPDTTPRIRFENDTANTSAIAGSIGLRGATTHTFDFLSPATLAASATDFSFARRNAAYGAGTTAADGVLTLSFGTGANSTEIDFNFATKADMPVTFTHAQGVGGGGIASGGTLNLEGFTGLDLVTPVTSGNVPTGAYGMFRYDTDGGGGSVDVLAFLSGQANATPAPTTAESSFWTMLSESDGASGSRLHFEPIVDYAVSAGSDNFAYIGYHNPLINVLSYYHTTGDGTEANPTHTFWSDYTTGMYLPSTTKLALVAGGEVGIKVEYDSGATDDVQVLMYPNGSASSAGLQALYISSTTDKVYRITSSARYKEHITDLDIDSSKLYDLRPVSYREKKTHIGGIGLIAEEVVKVMPELVVLNKEGTPEAVQYTDIPILMLNEMKKLKEEIKSLKEKN